MFGVRSIAKHFHQTLRLHSFALTTQGRCLAAANSDGAMHVFKLAEPGKVFRVLEPPTPD